MGGPEIGETTMIIAYRKDEEYELEPPCPSDWMPVRLAIAENVRVDRSARGDLLLYRGYLAYGAPVGAALKLGWCWPVEDAPEDSPRTLS